MSRKRVAAENPSVLAVCYRCGKSSSTSVDISGIEQVAPEFIYGVQSYTFHSIDCLFSQVSDKYGTGHRITKFLRSRLQEMRPAEVLHYVPPK